QSIDRISHRRSPLARLTGLIPHLRERAPQPRERLDDVGNFVAGNREQAADAHPRQEKRQNQCGSADVFDLGEELHGVPPWGKALPTLSSSCWDYSSPSATARASPTSHFHDGHRDGGLVRVRQRQQHGLRRSRDKLCVPRRVDVIPRYSCPSPLELSMIQLL